MVPNGSIEVFAIATPVSKPAWFVTNGNNRSQVQALMLKIGVEPVVLQKRGIGAAPCKLSCIVLSGAKLMFTVLAPTAGRFEAVLATAATAIGTVIVSTTFGLEYQTSYVTEAVVPLIGTEVGVADGGTLKVLPSNTATPVFCPFPTK